MQPNPSSPGTKSPASRSILLWPCKLAWSTSLAVGLAACGGSNPNDSVAALPSPASLEGDRGTAAAADIEPHAQIQRRLDNATHQGLTRTVLQLGASRGQFGATLAEDGWQFLQADSANLPLGANTVLYVNASEPGVRAATLQQQLAAFRGVLIIDSDRLATPDAAVVESAQEAPAFASADLLMALSGGQAKVVPLATALVLSRSSGRVLGIDVSASGLVNGASQDERQITSFNPLLALLHNIEQARFAAAQPERARALAQSVSAWDMRVEFAKVYDGWNASGETWVNAYRDGDGTLRHFIQMKVLTGSKATGCTVGGISCGIYPLKNDNIVFTPTATAQYVGQPIKVVASVERFTAYAQAFPAYGIVTALPNAQTPDLWEDPDFDIGWSERSLNIAGAVAASSTTFTSFPSGIPGVAVDTHFRKATNRWWIDHKREWVSDNRAKASSSFHVGTRNYLDTVVMPEQLLHPSVNTAEAAAGRRKFRDMVLNGRYCFEQTGASAGIVSWQNRDSSYRRSRLSYEGWNPHIDVLFEVDKNRILRRDDRAFIDVRGGLTYSRPEFSFMRSDSARCLGQFGAATAHRTGYRLESVQSTRGGDGYHTTVPTKWREYDAGVNLRVNHTLFDTR